MQVDCEEFRDNFPLWTLIFLLAVVCCSAGEDEVRMIGPSQPIIAEPGDDVILPCQLDPPLNVEKFVVRWWRPDFKPDPSDKNWVNVVLLYYMKEAPEKIPSYINRTQLFTEELRHGNISLKILNVTSADTGRYRCDIQNLMKYSIVQLVVVEFKMNSSSEPIVAAPGDDVILPCQLDPASDAQNLSVQWSRPDLKTKRSENWAYYVLLYRGGREVLDLKIPSYVNRTQMFTEELQHGNVSLKILKVTSGDAGRYRCYTRNKFAVVQLVVTEVDRISVWMRLLVFCFFLLVLIVIGYVVKRRQKAAGYHVAPTTQCPAQVP